MDRSPFALATPAAPPRVVRPRAFARPWRLLAVALLHACAFAGFLAFVAGLAGMAVLNTQGAGVLALSGLLSMAGCRIAAFGLSRSLRCALCHNPVMSEKRCQKHREARRMPLLSHRAWAVACVLTTATFRCIYCGTPYRLRK